MHIVKSGATVGLGHTGDVDNAVESSGARR